MHCIILSVAEGSFFSKSYPSVLLYFLVSKVRNSEKSSGFKCLGYEEEKVANLQVKVLNRERLKKAIVSIVDLDS